jgi:acyl-CoA thioesterase FadM
MGSIAAPAFINRVLISDDRVGFQDCDGYFHLNNARYTDMLINHRGFSAEENLALSPYELGKKLGMGMIVQQIGMRFVSSAQLHETVEIASWAFSISKDGFSVRATIAHKEKRIVRAAAEMMLRFVDLKTGKLMGTPAEWPTASEEDLIGKRPMADEYIQTLKGVPEGFLKNGLVPVGAM